MSEPLPPLSRRQALNRLGWGSFAAVLLLLAGVMFDVLRSTSRFWTLRWKDAGPVSRFPVGQMTPIPGLRAAVYRRQDRLAAISLVCPHLGCIVNPVDDGFFCPCHGSEFGPLGELYSGPAKAPLGWYSLKIRRGRLMVSRDKPLAEPDWVQWPEGGEA